MKKCCFSGLFENAVGVNVYLVFDRHSAVLQPRCVQHILNNVTTSHGMRSVSFYNLLDTLLVTAGTYYVSNKTLKDKLSWVNTEVV